MTERTSSDGKEYEKLAESIFKKIYENVGAAKIERDIRLDSKYGKRQFDVVITDVYEDFNISVIVECKDYANPVDIGCIEGYISKLNDFDVNRKFIVAKSGFTKQAINKATDNDIFCCTAQEAQHSDWHIDDYIPVYLTETYPRYLRFQYNLNVKPKESFHPWTINGIDLKSEFRKKWEQGNIDPGEGDESEVAVYFDVAPPFLMEYKSPDGSVEFRDVGALSVSSKWARRYYKTSLNELKKTQMLKYVGRDAFHIFLCKEEISDHECSMEEISKEDIDYSQGLALLIYSRPDIKFEEQTTVNDFVFN